eukprot:CAMPEP_0169345838 /NCGR_PEP_ID=MMETSP1017-20121227/21788_1 /TAXON_ID=342587 /ORGANISM="Karlodinium micrum, Strain CCMP2283" /LENGTH=351 /DNA_ID=CAMNT_0009441717 /DNA_START=35 /DNA_END=1090 /DNA_ORIENTATION=-
MRAVIYAVCIGSVCTAWRRTGPSDPLKRRGNVGSAPPSREFETKQSLANVLLAANPALTFRAPAAYSARVDGKGRHREGHRMQISDAVDPESEKPPMPWELEGSNDLSMSLGSHIEEFRERLIFAGMMVVLLILASFGFSKDLINVLKSPIVEQGVKFIQSNPSEYFFTSIKVSGYSGLLLAAPIILNQIIAYVVPGLTASEKKLFGPLLLGSTALFYVGLTFGFGVLGPAALNFFLAFAEESVESFFSIDEYADFVGFMMLSTGVAFQVPIIQTLLAKLGVVNSQQMFDAWRYVVVGAVILAAFLTPSTDPLTQLLLAGPLVGLYLGGAAVVRLTEGEKPKPPSISGGEE